MGFRGRLKHAWNVFRSRDDTMTSSIPGVSWTSKPDRIRLFVANERSILAAIYTRMAIDAASIDIRHVRTDVNGRYVKTISSGLNECLSVQANKDQTGRALVLDMALSLFDEGVIAIVPIETSLNPKISNAYDIDAMRVGKIMEWYPDHVRVRLYNDIRGDFQEYILPKKTVAIAENPFYPVMNEPNSTYKRLVHKLNLLDKMDDDAGSGKLDLIIQLPYVTKTPLQQDRAEKRRKDIEVQLSGSKYGIAYIDGTERVTQLNRPVENNLMSQIEYLTRTLYSQLGLTEEILNGTADEKTMLNYYNRTIEPILSAIIEAMKCKFITKTARTQGQSIMFFRDPFKLAPVNEIANMADKFTRNEILTSNEMRALIGFRPVDDPRANELRNKNLNSSSDQLPQQAAPGEDYDSPPGEESGDENYNPVELGKEFVDIFGNEIL